MVEYRGRSDDTIFLDDYLVFSTSGSRRGFCGTEPYLPEVRATGEVDEDELAGTILEDERVLVDRSVGVGRSHDPGVVLEVEAVRTSQ